MLLLQATTVQITKTESALDILLKGGWILIPLFLLSIVAIYFIIERFTLYRSYRRIDVSIIDEICKAIHAGNFQKVQQLAKNYHHPVGRILAKGLENPNRPIADIEQIMADHAKAEVVQMEKNLGYIGSIATIAPMFGFLGTIFGVIKIFYNISLADNISIGIIASGLYQKMVSSAVGLTIGILAYAGFYYLNTQIDDIVNRMEIQVNRVLIALKDYKNCLNC
ncbi:MAG: MotA/TolQ/ExbB proton channel family protein [Bacteroidales bacterium]|nr:MotA/TolQ/ExbB proton channel family protein [Bacteroidales bacterium]